MHAMSTTDLLDELVALLQRALEILQTIQQKTGNTLPDVASKLRRRECLKCGTLVEPGGEYTRGLCGKHYHKMRRLVRENRVTEDALVAAGELAPTPEHIAASAVAAAISPALEDAVKQATGTADPLDDIRQAVKDDAGGGRSPQ